MLEEDLYDAYETLVKQFDEWWAKWYEMRTPKKMLKDYFAQQILKHYHIIPKEDEVSHECTENHAPSNTAGAD